MVDDELRQLVNQVEGVLPPHVGACVLGIDAGEVVFEHAWGMADVASRSPCTSATNFRMASVSKQFTAASVMLLIERGRLNLTDTMDRFFPGFPRYGSSISVRHLLTHTSGIPAYEDLVPTDKTLQLDDLDVLRLLMDAAESKFAPGTKFEYSNSGYVLLGLIVELAERKPFHTFVGDELFTPLGMTNSVVYQRGLNEVANRAFGHRNREGEWVRDDQSVTSATRGDGSIYTSLTDFRRWLRAIDERTLLRAKSWEEMFKSQVVSDRDGSRYGFGWFIDDYRGLVRVHHNGDTRGFRLCVQRFPQRRAAVLVQLNGEVDDGKSPMTKVGERVADLVILDRIGTK